MNGRIGTKILVELNLHIFFSNSIRSLNTVTRNTGSSPGTNTNISHLEKRIMLFIVFLFAIIPNGPQYFSGIYL